MISASFFACSLFSNLQEKEKKSYLLLTVIINYILQTVILKYSALELSYTQKQKQSKKKKKVPQLYFQKEVFLIPFVSPSLQARN